MVADGATLFSGSGPWKGAARLGLKKFTLLAETMSAALS